MRLIVIGFFNDLSSQLFDNKYKFFLRFLLEYLTKKLKDDLNSERDLISLFVLGPTAISGHRLYIDLFCLAFK